MSGNTRSITVGTALVIALCALATVAMAQPPGAFAPQAGPGQGIGPWAGGHGHGPGIGARGMRGAMGGPGMGRGPGGPGAAPRFEVTPASTKLWNEVGLLMTRQHRAIWQLWTLQGQETVDENAVEKKLAELKKIHDDTSKKRAALAEYTQFDGPRMGAGHGRGSEPGRGRQTGARDGHGRGPEGGRGRQTGARDGHGKGEGHCDGDCENCKPK